MRVSAVLAGAFALTANASPQAASEQCYNAVYSQPSAKAACSSFLRTTVTPCAKTKTVTKTTTSTRKATVTTTAVTVTKTIASTTSTTAAANANVPPSSGNNKRVAAQCPASSKPSKVPAGISQRCNSKAYSAACTAIGVKPATTTLPASTVVTTKTVAAFVTSTVIVTATQTVTVSETQAPDVESCFYLAADASTTPGGYLFVGLSSGGFRSAIGDNLGKFKLSNGSLYVTNASGRTALAYTRTDNGAVPHPDVDFLYFTSDFTKQDLTCRIEDDDLYCDSTAVADKTRGDMVYCSWSRGVDVPTPARSVAFSSGNVPTDCKATTLKVIPCGDIADDESA